MIWVDSSFAIEWLLGSRIASKVSLPQQKWGILPAQYAEILVFFGKKINDITPVIAQLEGLTLENPRKTELQVAARLYLKAKRVKQKVSLADAILGAIAMARGEIILTFDDDFKELGFIGKEGVWSLQKGFS